MRTNATIFKVMGWIAIVATVLTGLGMIVFGLVSGEREAVLPMLLAGGFSVVFGVLIGILYFKIAKGISERKGWAKTWGMVFSIIWLFSVPVGTILGIILLLGFSDEESKAWFDGTQPGGYIPPPNTTY